MTRSDLVEALAMKFRQLTHRDAEFAVKTLLDAMSEALSRGHRIELRGFGTFSVNRRPPRMGRNPRSGESVAIPEKRVPHFKPGKALLSYLLVIQLMECFQQLKNLEYAPMLSMPQDQTKLKLKRLKN